MISLAHLFAAELAKIESTDDIREPNDEAFEWFRRPKGGWEIAEANLKSLCGLAGAIDGIAAWGHKFATTTKFDEAAPKRDLPDISMDFAQEISTQSFGVSLMRSYAISAN